MVTFSNFTNNFVATYHADKSIRVFDLINFAQTDEIPLEEPASHNQYSYDD